jgi:hypothetical protein
LKKNLLVSIVVMILLYLASYLVFRFTHVETREKDQRTYVIFPERNNALYYFFRPLTYADAALTDMRFHIGPHE